MKSDNEDIVIEDDPDSAASDATLKKLRGKLKAAEAKAKEYLDGWQRERAEIANTRKRDEESKQEFVKFASEGLIIELLPVLDSFDMALSHGSSDLEPVRKQLLSVLTAHGLEVLDPLGQNFDPKLHESIGVIKTQDKGEDDKILEVAQKGYILSKKIIRPAKVKIGEFPRGIPLG